MPEWSHWESHSGYPTSILKVVIVIKLLLLRVCMYPCVVLLCWWEVTFTTYQIVVLPSESTHTVVASAIRLEPF